jgi:hypothetical protein
MIRTGGVIELSPDVGPAPDSGWLAVEIAMFPEITARAAP